MGTVSAWQASDGTLFKSYSDFQKYQSAQFANSAVMFKIDTDRTLSRTTNITEANFVMLSNEDDKATFKAARIAANEDISVSTTSFGRTVEGLNIQTSENESYFGVFGIYSQDGINWAWYPIDEYIRLLNEDIALAEKASGDITMLFLLNNR